MITPQNIKLHELIGLQVRVVESLSLPYRKIEGRIVDETKNTFVIEGQDGIERRVPKRGCVFEFVLPSKRRVRLDGETIAFRPYDRPKKLR
ncbi:MAG: ribonuclease P protein subunit [Candidatus Micrarchaeota archaeon]|nr:ribonuclease P protein subunit [Candidatus Micrarchaeota archaeon]